MVNTIWERAYFYTSTNHGSIRKPIGILLGAKFENSNPVLGYRNIVTIGCSFCHPHDEFDLEYGYSLAHKRACDAYYYGYTYPVHDIGLRMNYIMPFMQRCVRYFKNCFVVYPKITESKVFKDSRYYI